MLLPQLPISEEVSLQALFPDLNQVGPGSWPRAVFARPAGGDAQPVLPPSWPGNPFLGPGPGFLAIPSLYHGQATRSLCPYPLGLPVVSVA